jgi:hypothetical protein
LPEKTFSGKKPLRVSLSNITPSLKTFLKPHPDFFSSTSGIEAAPNQHSRYPLFEFFSMRDVLRSPPSSADPGNPVKVMVWLKIFLTNHPS